MRRSILSLPAALLLIVTAASAAPSQPLAESVEVVGHVSVDYRDLDLRNDADARAMLGRLERAAFQACGGNPKWHHTYELMPRRTVEVFQECRRDAVANAVAHINAPALSALYHRSDAARRVGT